MIQAALSSLTCNRSGSESVFSAVFARSICHSSTEEIAPMTRIDNRTTAEIPKTRMGQIRNCNSGYFQPQSRLNLRRHRRPILEGNFVHDLVAPEIIDHGIAGLDRMKHTARRRRLE